MLPSLHRDAPVQGGSLSGFQRSRILLAALEEASASGFEQTSVSSIVARARVSRKTFYELFDNREDCLCAVFEEAVAQMAQAVAPSYTQGQGRWSEQVRAALGALLALLERELDIGAFVLEYVTHGARVNPEPRLLLLEHLRSVFDDGRSQAKSSYEPSPLAADVVVGGVLAVLHARVQTSPRHLASLMNPLMSMIVLPHLGPAAAARELRRPPLASAAKRAKAARGPLEGLGMRVTYRTARALSVIAHAPGRSNVEIGSRVDIADAGQTSKLLARLEGLGLIENRGAGHAYGAPNAWHLTRKGREVDAAIGAQAPAGGPSRSAR
ncbi:MAG TPA: TetR family transcriptional regulator [Solirubrobacteraceae bacterium]|nr:TetR family transcriptional regulator [Solirubrobacteraceae bacterium]